MAHLVILGVMVLIGVGKMALDTPGAEQQQPIQPQKIQHSEVADDASGVGAFQVSDSDQVEQALAALQRNAALSGR